MPRQGHLHAPAIGVDALHQLPRHVVDADVALCVLHHNSAVLHADVFSVSGLHVVNACRLLLFHVQEVLPNTILLVSGERAYWYCELHVLVLLFCESALASSRMISHVQGLVVLLYHEIRELEATRESVIAMDLGMMALSKLTQSVNAEPPICVTVLGMLTPVMLEQPLKASSPIKVTELGMLTLRKPVHPSKAELPMTLTE